MKVFDKEAVAGLDPLYFGANIARMYCNQSAETKDLKKFTDNLLEENTEFLLNFPLKSNQNRTKGSWGWNAVKNCEQLQSITPSNHSTH